MESWAEKWAKINSVPGWLSEEEAIILYDVAKNAPPGPLVEIGAWLGLSTATLAFGAQDSGLDPDSKFVVSVDTWEGSKNAAEEGYHSDIIRSLGVTDLSNLHQENILRLELSKWSKQFKGPSVPDGVERARKEFSHISMLFIDGCHEYREVKQDFENWAPLVARGGSVLFHDSTWPGPERVISEVSAELFQRVPAAGGLTWFKKP